jgi:oxygen-dependent protoporphyrinogen oxidase
LRGRAKAEGGDTPKRGGFGGKLTAFDAGMQTLTDALAQALGARLHLAHHLTAMAWTDGTWRLAFQTAQGETSVAGFDRVVLAIPSWVAADLIRPWDDTLAATLAEIPYAAVSVVALGFARHQIAHALDGFGLVVPGAANVPLLGCLWSSSIFPGRSPADHVLLRCMVGGLRHPEAAALPDNDLVDAVLAVLRPLLGIEGSPSFRHIVRWPKAIPQYHVGHATRLARLGERLAKLAPLTLAGNAYRGVGIADCIREATAVTDALIMD